MKVAIAGSGISGMGMAFLLDSFHDVTLYERNAAPGGHSRTVDVQTPKGKIPVDTGFIVFNELNYPLLTGLFDYLNVPVAPTSMSFGVSIEDGFLEYSTENKPASLFAQKKNLFRPLYWKMLLDITAFNRKAPAYLECDPDITLRQCLDELGMGSWFRNYYLLAMGAAIWSMPLAQMPDFPARTFIRFFHNHGLLTVNRQPRWYTVIGGAREYVKRLTSSFSGKIKLDCGVEEVVRRGGSVEILDTQGNRAIYDMLVFACNAGEALELLAEPTQEEKEILGAIKSQKNRMVLHSDKRFMPKKEAAWASWTYLSNQKSGPQANPELRQPLNLSYWMNNLQPLNTDIPIIVTLNPGFEPDADLVHDSHQFEHPIFNRQALAAQKRINQIQGKDCIWYVGAWQRYGFHEDGLLSAVNVAEKLGIKPPWK